MERQSPRTCPATCTAARARRRTVDGAANARSDHPGLAPFCQPLAALEPFDLPPAIEQGVDMIYIDQELIPNALGP